MEEMDLRELMGLLAHYRKRLVVAFGCLCVMGLLFSFSWSRYTATATVEVALPEVSSVVTEAPETVAATKEAMVDRQISYLQQRVLSTGSLVEIITKYDLYAKNRRKQPMAVIAEGMRRKIKLDLVGGSFANPSAAQKVSAGQLSAIAFTLTFTYTDPLMAQKVTNELVSRFLDEDISQKRSQAKETNAFLDEQVKTLGEALVEQEKKLAEFYSTYGETRPEALAFNQQAATSLLLSLQNLDSQISTNLGEQGALRARLAGLDPYSSIIADGKMLTSPSIQLRALKSEYATLSAKYGPSHPDVVKISRQIEAMEAGQGKGPSTAILKSLVQDAQTRLDSAQKVSGEKHPDVIALRRELAAYQAQLDKGEATSDDLSLIQKDADNPAYLQVVAQIKSVEEQARALRAQKKAISEELAKKQQAVIENPGVEQKLAALTRDYENDREHYRQLKVTKQSAEMNAAIEQDRVGQRLILINPPELPLTTSPPRALLAVVSMVCAAGGALVLVVVPFFFSPVVIGSTHMASLVGVAPLVRIPHISVMTDRKISVSRTRKRLGLILALAVLAAVLFSTFVMPLDVLVSVVALKLGLV
ncbi:MAG: hypothetical protein PHW63_06380 [Alphaproteobacteria bacterium]|nr:hypothetical protein [Alphaproteobacteria bacterium]